MIKLIADSTCDLTDAIVERYDISIAPLSITFEGQTYKDRIELNPNDFYDMLSSLETLPTTAMPSPVEFMTLYEEAVKDGYDEILVITMSSGTSGSYQSAVIATNYFFDEDANSHIKVHVVDSKCMSHGSGYLLMKSAMLRDQGATFQELIDFNETYKTNVKHFLAVDDLNNLIKSGRLSNASAMIGKLLKVKPVMSMRSGKGAIVAKVRGSKKVLSHYVEAFKERVDDLITDFIMIGYTSDKSVAENLKEKILNETSFKGDIYLMQMGVVVGTHVGLGGISMYFVEEGDRHDGLVYNSLKDLMAKKTEVIEMIKRLKSPALGKV